MYTMSLLLSQFVYCIFHSLCTAELAKECRMYNIGTLCCNIRARVTLVKLCGDVNAFKGTK